jgi:hypothetical protein
LCQQRAAQVSRSLGDTVQAVGQDWLSLAPMARANAHRPSGLRDPPLAWPSETAAETYDRPTCGQA